MMCGERELEGVHGARHLMCCVLTLSIHVTSKINVILPSTGGIIAGIISDRLNARAITCVGMLLLAVPMVSRPLPRPNLWRQLAQRGERLMMPNSPTCAVCM